MVYLLLFIYPRFRGSLPNVLVRPYTQGTIKQLLTDQITHSVKWTDSIHYLTAKGVCHFVEIGPGNVLSKLITKTIQEELK